MKKILLVVLALLISEPAFAANDYVTQIKKHDNAPINVLLIDNGDTTYSLAVAASTSAPLNVTVSSTSADGNDTVLTSTHAVSGSAVQVLAANVNREGTLICNEGPTTARCSIAAGLTSDVGQRLLTDQCWSPDGTTRPYRGAISCITASAATIIQASEAE